MLQLPDRIAPRVVSAMGYNHQGHNILVRTLLGQDHFRVFELQYRGQGLSGARFSAVSIFHHHYT